MSVINLLNKEHFKKKSIFVTEAITYFVFTRCGRNGAFMNSLFHILVLALISRGVSSYHFPGYSSAVLQHFARWNIPDSTENDGTNFLYPKWYKAQRNYRV